MILFAQKAGIGVKHSGRWLEFRVDPQKGSELTVSCLKVGGTGCSISEEFWQYSV